jgi:hypothetical protein
MNFVAGVEWGANDLRSRACKTQSRPFRKSKDKQAKPSGDLRPNRSVDRRGYRSVLLKSKKIVGGDEFSGATRYQQKQVGREGPRREV